MRKHSVIYSILATWFVIAVAFGGYKSGELQLLFMLTTVVFVGTTLVSFFVAIREWPAHGFRAAVPLVACAAAFTVFPFCASLVRQALFQWNLSSYERIVQRKDIQNIPPGRESVRLELSDEERELAYAIIAERTANNTLLVEIATDSAFPVKHFGYVFSSSGLIEPGSHISSRWPYTRQVHQHWFRVSD